MMPVYEIINQIKYVYIYIYIYIYIFIYIRLLMYEVAFI